VFKVNVSTFFIDTTTTEIVDDEPGLLVVGKGAPDGERHVRVLDGRLSHDGAVAFVD
jgi:hypothetical protein